MENCTLCLNSIERQNVHIIKTDTVEILSVIFENKSLQLTQGHVVCRDCSEKIEAAFNFKCTCINTEDFLVPFERLKDTLHINLKKLTVTVNGKEEVIVIPERYEVCRLCLDLVNENFISLLNETHKCRLQTFIPKLNVESTLNPVICINCFKSLEQHTTFINNCLQLQEKIKTDQEKSINECRETEVQTVADHENGRNFDESELLNLTPTQEESNNIQITAINKEGPENKKCEENLREGIICKIDLRLLNLENLKNKKEISTANKTKRQALKDLPPNKEKIAKCDISKSNGLKNLPPDKNFCEKKRYKCNKCEFQTSFEHDLTLHKLKHEENPSKMQKYTCASCSYETQSWTSLKLHKLMYKHSLDVHMHKCNFCLYETKSRMSMELHILKHDNLEKVPVYQNQSQTKSKHSLVSHKSKQGNNVTWCKSTETSKQERVDTLKYHKMNYKQLSEIQMYKCKLCGYEIKHKGALDLHVLKHKSNCERQMYKYNKSEHYNRKTTGELKRGNQFSEIQYKCSLCYYEAKHKQSLELHMSKHKSISEKQMYNNTTKESQRKPVKNDLLQNKWY